MAQQVIVLRNAAMSETAVHGAQRKPRPTHVCEEDERGRVCTMHSECAWLRRWREEQTARAAESAA